MFRRSLVWLVLVLGALLATSCGPPAPSAPGDTVQPLVLSGIVHDTGGHPIARARVYFTSGPSPLPDIAALTDDAGTFALSVSAPGSYSVECAADGFVTAPVTVEVTTSQRIEVELSRMP